MKDYKITQRDEDVKNFFLQHGFTHSWDFSAASGEIWNEFYLDGKLICQIDVGVPLKCLVEDLKCWRDKKEPTSRHEYKFNIGNHSNVKTLFDALKDALA